ncbi:MAG: hypothetical protein NTX72_06220 [Candidatus Uhrbacteria bacterium]|nr:hypothetical protein [Candidatus Uhrbacteria bacterium]
MLSSLRRISDRFVSEASAWLGAHERLTFEVVRCVKGDDLERYFANFPDPHVMLRRVLPNGISQQLIRAGQKGRKILCMFMIDLKGAIGDEYVITIDMDRRRVDRKLSSPELLLDPWFKPRDEPWFGELVYSADVRHSELIDLLDIPFVGLGGRPFRSHYEHRFFKRQNQISESFGYSRRFASLFSRLAPQLDPETCLLFRRALGNLWTHEQWMRRKVDLVDAERALSEAHLDVTFVCLKDHGYFQDEMLTQVCIWTDADENVIAQAEVSCNDYGVDRKPYASVYVFGSSFGREDGIRLLNCFKDKTETNLRNETNPVLKWK